MQTVRISPDGKRLAYTAAANGESMLVTLNLETKELTPILRASEARESGERTMSGYRWIGNDHIVITTISRENIEGQLGDFRRLVACNVHSGELVQQAWDKAGGDAGFIKHIDHDTGTYLLQRDAIQESLSRYGFPEVVKVDVATGKYSMVQRTNPEVRDWGVDSNGEVRSGSRFDGDSGKVRVMFKAEGDRNLKTAYNQADETWTSGAPDPSMFILGTNMVYTLANHQGHTAVYKMDMTTLDLTEKVFSTDGFDVQGIILNEDRSKVLGYRTFDGTMCRVFTDPHLKAVKSMLEEVFGKDEAVIIDYTADLSKIVVYAGGMTKFGGYFMFETQSGSLNLLNWEKTSLKDAPANPMKAEWYTASDGTKIQTIVTYPRHRKGQGNLPVLVMPHGGPFGAIDSAEIGFFPWHQAIAEQGYVVIQPNYRGSGGYGKDFVSLGRRPGGYGKRM
ncbi:prolyl oligopeptidase family serine peptidase [Erythrobacter sp. KMU-140]|uniref:Prolyl oligopeptidase family serine peptidase n=1 Tax=Erythrobacter rubeus TaxID=2760803 RepID=A0ABR8KVR9_9SPHN|nr:prolyl oligopeptidase family serine peptidase [Erythrobacter rubeus]